MVPLWREADLSEANRLLAANHYLGPIRRGRLIIGGYIDGVLVAAQVWTLPTSRRLPSDGSWLELARWCLTPEAGANAGSRQHAAAVRVIRRQSVTTLVSYSDPSHGHTGALYRACNWVWAPTWLRLRPPPTGNGDWGTGGQAVKDRWLFSVGKDARLPELAQIDDAGAIRHWLAHGSEAERRWARRSPASDLRESVQVPNGRGPAG